MPTSPDALAAFGAVDHEMNTKEEMENNRSSGSNKRQPLAPKPLERNRFQTIDPKGAYNEFPEMEKTEELIRNEISLKDIE